MPKRRQLADVVVNRKWWNESMARLLTGSSVTGNEGGHRVRGPLVERDFSGVWIGEAPSNLQHLKDPSLPVVVTILIPWDQVLALAIIDEPRGVKMGFEANPPA